MLRLGLKACLFSLMLIPLLLYRFLLPIYIGEAINYQDIAQKQFDNPDLIFKQAYTDNFFDYKLRSTLLHQPEVLIMGSSRTMQFRAPFLNKQPNAFYNAGGVGYNPLVTHKFLLTLLEANVKPKIIILGLDSLLVNACYWQDGIVPATLPEEIQSVNLLTLNYTTSVSRWTWEDLWVGKISLKNLVVHREPIHQRPALGLQAIASGDGFRADGSLQAGSSIEGKSTPEQLLAEGWERLQNSIPPFVPCDTISTGNLQIFSEQVLQYAQAHGIFVIGFSPPLAPTIYTALINSGKFPFLEDAPALWQALFEQYGFAYFNFADVSALGVTDADMIDSFHGSEWVYLLMYIEMVKALPDVLGHYSDLPYLQSQADASSNHYEVFEQIFTP